MKANNHIPASLTADLNANLTEHIAQATIVKTIIAFAIALLAAVVLLSGAQGPAWLPTAMVSTALLAAVIGFVCLFGSRKELRLNGKKLTGYRLYFKTGSAQEIIRLINERNSRELKKMLNPQEGGLRLNLMMADDGSIARYRIFKYVPFDYQPESDIVEANLSTATFISEL